LEETDDPIHKRFVSGGKEIPPQTFQFTTTVLGEGKPTNFHAWLPFLIASWGGRAVTTVTSLRKRIAPKGKGIRMWKTVPISAWGERVSWQGSNLIT